MLYIGGTGRTGSTVLDSLLGSFPGVFSGGELAFFWRYGLKYGGRCSCGERLQECSVWSGIIRRAFGDDGVDAERMVELRRQFRSPHLPLMVVPAYRKRGLARLEEFPRQVERLYDAIAATSGARLIVDSSKEPHYSYILREAMDLDISFLQLVRDPRAVGMSWRRPRPEPGFGDDARMEQRKSVRASAYYDVSNVAAEMLWGPNERYAFMRYEDLIARPHEAVTAIGEFVGVELDVGSVLDSSNSFVRADLHSAWGNPNRFDQGRTTLKSDDAWIGQLGTMSRIALTALTFPLVHRYGYPGWGPLGDLRRPRGRPARRQLAAAYGG